MVPLKPLYNHKCGRLRCFLTGKLLISVNLSIVTYEQKIENPQMKKKQINETNQILLI